MRKNTLCIPPFFVSVIFDPRRKQVPPSQQQNPTSRNMEEVFEETPSHTLEPVRGRDENTILNKLFFRQEFETPPNSFQAEIATQ
jgi:hypothetical protein